MRNKDIEVNKFSPYSSRLLFVEDKKGKERDMTITLLSYIYCYNFLPHNETTPLDSFMNIKYVDVIIYVFLASKQMNTSCQECQSKKISFDCGQGMYGMPP